MFSVYLDQRPGIHRTIADQEKIRFILAMHETCVVSMGTVTRGLPAGRSWRK